MKKTKAYWEMSTKELAEVTKQFDEPFVIDKSRPLTVLERGQWNRLKRRKGRPKIGKGFQRICVSMEKGLLKQVNALAKKQGLSRSSFLAQLCEQALARES
jgi:hypothetical protein